MDFPRDGKWVWVLVLVANSLSGRYLLSAFVHISNWEMALWNEREGQPIDASAWKPCQVSMLRLDIKGMEPLEFE